MFEVKLYSPVVRVRPGSLRGIRLGDDSPSKPSSVTAACVDGTVAVVAECGEDDLAFLQWFHRYSLLRESGEFCSIPSFFIANGSES